jgi:hypothetical protein
MTEQCDQEGKECRYRYICPQQHKAKQPNPCPEYRYDDEFNRGWI